MQEFKSKYLLHLVGEEDRKQRSLPCIVRLIFQYRRNRPQSHIDVRRSYIGGYDGWKVSTHNDGFTWLCIIPVYSLPDWMMMATSSLE